MIYAATDSEWAVGEPARLWREPFPVDEPGEQDVIAEPLFGCWEANMTHALDRQPIDVCRQRGEARVVLGNAWVVRVLETGQRVRHVRPGDVARLALQRCPARAAPELARDSRRHDCCSARRTRRRGGTVGSPGGTDHA